MGKFGTIIKLLFYCNNGRQKDQQIKSGRIMELRFQVTTVLADAIGNKSTNYDSVFFIKSHVLTRTNFFVLSQIRF